MSREELALEVAEARKRIERDILKTPLIYSYFLSEKVGGDVFLKLENEQYTGSFKARGSLNKIRSLSNKKESRMLVTASTGNHGLGFARAVALEGVNGIIFLPQDASRAKVKKLKRFPVELRFYDGTSLDTEIAGRQFAADNQAIWISPYNDYQVIAGQGTIALELFEQIENFDNILITVGGGGLISGIGTMVRLQQPNTQIIACQPERSPEMTLSLKAGHIVSLEDSLPTLSDGSAGGIESDSVTFDICKEVIDDSILVNEDEIKEAIRMMVHEHGKIIEGSAGVPIASLLQDPKRFRGKRTVLVLCGGNIEVGKLQEILCK